MVKKDSNQPVLCGKLVVSSPDSARSGPEAYLQAYSHKLDTYNQANRPEGHLKEPFKLLFNIEA
jgi:hypothetical protein